MQQPAHDVALHAHWPATHSCPTAQAIPQPPQLAALVDGSTQPASHSRPAQARSARATRSAGPVARSRGGAGGLADAYGRMSAGYRKDHDLATFERTLRDHRADVDVATARLRAGGAAVELRAEARYGDGETLPLVIEGGAWRIAADPLDF